MSDLIFAGGTVVTAEGSFAADVAVSGETIEAVGVDLPRDGAEVVDCAGAKVMPGFIDGHTHMDMPFGGTMTADDWDTGTASALAGGTTMLVDFSLQDVDGTLAEAVETWQGKAEKSRIDYGLHVAITNLTDEVKQELPSLPELGVATVKIFMAYKGTPLYTADEDLFEAMQIARECGLLVLVHAENGDAIAKLQEQALARGDTEPRWHGLTRPEAVEAEATNRAIRLAEIADCPLLVVHVSCADALQEIERAHARGQTVYGETCGQYFVFSDEDLARPGFEGAKYVCSPPLRDPSNRPALWHGLQAGDLQIFGSDHCSFNYAGQKELGADDFTLIPNGLPGRRGAPVRALDARRARGDDHGEPVRRRGLHEPGARARDGRPQGHARAGRRRRRRRLGPRHDGQRDAVQPSRQRRLHAVRGHDVHRRAGGRLRARRARVPRRRGHRRARLGPLRAPHVRAPRPRPGGPLMAAADAARAVAGLQELRRRTGDDDGAQRVAWTDTWIDARKWLRDELDSIDGVTVETDEAGNTWASAPGDHDRFVIVGGHLDSVPDGGWLDGALNVVAGLEVLRALAGEDRPVGIKLVDWADEEGARFGRSLMGSSACAGTLDPDSVRGLTDKDGTALPDALAQHGVELDRMKESNARLEGAPPTSSCTSSRARCSSRWTCRSARCSGRSACSATWSASPARTRTRARRRCTCAATRSSPRRAARSRGATTPRGATTCARRPGS